MRENRKEAIMMATLELAAQHGLGHVSMNMIAERVGIKKPSLYNHFASKEALIEELYRFLRQRAMELAHPPTMDYGKLFREKSALDILRQAVSGYVHMTSQKELLAFYKVIYSERTIHPMAAKIMAEEAETMVAATRQLFYAMQVHHLLNFKNADMSALSFAMTIHGLIDYSMDRRANEAEGEPMQNDWLESYLTWFCGEHTIKE